MAEGILLVGGFGTRLRPLTNHRPKPMLPIASLPVTEHQLAMARRAGIKRIVLATSYLSEVFIPYFGDGSKWRDRPVLIVGTGTSAHDIAQDLHSHGARVSMLQRNSTLVVNVEPSAQLYDGLYLGEARQECHDNHQQVFSRAVFIFFALF